MTILAITAIAAFMIGGMPAMPRQAAVAVPRRKPVTTTSTALPGARPSMR
jgi:hypothetical protein